jgi:hypothetical protein
VPTSPYTRTGVVLPVGSDPDQVPFDLKRIADQYETVNVLWSTSSYASRPTAGKPGRLHQASDANILSVDTGTTWVEYARRPQNVGALPATPYDGDEIVYRPRPDTDADPGAAWRFRYVASLPAAVRWQFQGGSATASVLTADTGTQPGNNGDIRISAASIIAPFAGIYEVTGHIASAYYYGSTIDLRLFAGAADNGGTGTVSRSSPTSVVSIKIPSIGGPGGSVVGTSAALTGSRIYAPAGARVGIATTTSGTSNPGWQAFGLQAFIKPVALAG